jgi:hypothetical protein
MNTAFNLINNKFIYYKWNKNFNNLNKKCFLIMIMYILKIINFKLLFNLLSFDFKS